MKIPIYQIDAFASAVFKGNAAAVCPLDEWLNDQVMQSIAMENNLSETAFIVQKNNKEYAIRWFTPKTEVDLCGHATLASGYVVLHYIDPIGTSVTFHSKSGPLEVCNNNDLLTMDFPAQSPAPCNAPIDLIKGLGKTPKAVLRGEDYLAVFETEEDVTSLQPDMKRLSELDLRGVCVTAVGSKVDFVSRFFAPKYGIDEDPVTGSTHCMLVPYWKTKLDKKSFHALQVSERGGELFCEDDGQRVVIAGKAVLYMQGTITV